MAFDDIDEFRVEERLAVDEVTGQEWFVLRGSVLGRLLHLVTV